jgi:hypothetical protein
METLAQDAVIRQSVYGQEHPCMCVPSEYCHWQCICDEDGTQVAPDKGYRRINISSGEDASCEC